jgi:transcriptional regulator with XRE-family HTH domain
LSIDFENCILSDADNCCVKPEAVINRRGRKEKPLANSRHRLSPLSTALRAWRTYRGLSQTQLAVQAGFGLNGRAHISSIESGKIQRPEDETLDKITAVLGLEAEDLRSGCMPPTGQVQEALESVQTLKQPQPTVVEPSTTQPATLEELKAEVQGLKFEVIEVKQALKELIPRPPEPIPSPILTTALELEEELQQVESTTETPQRMHDQSEDELDWLIAAANECIGQSQIKAAWLPIARLHKLTEKYSHDKFKLLNIHLLFCGAYCASGYFIDAEKWGQIGLAESIQLKKPEKTIEFRYLLAVILNALGKGTAALEQVNNALEETNQLPQQFKENVMFSKARIMALKGEILRDLGEWGKAKDYLQETKEFAHQSGALFAEAIALSNMTVLYSYLGDLHLAVSCCKQSWELKKEANKVSPIEKAYYHAHLGKVHRSLMENTENQQIIHDHSQRGIFNLCIAINLFETAGDKFHAAQTRLDLANLHAHCGVFSRALKLSQHALQFSEEARLMLLQAKAHTTLGIIHTLQDSMHEAKGELDKSLKIFQEYKIERPNEQALTKEALHALYRLSGVG